MVQWCGAGRTEFKKTKTFGQFLPSIALLPSLKNLLRVTVDGAELLTRQSDGWSIDDGHQLLHIVT